MDRKIVFMTVLMLVGAVSVELAFASPTIAGTEKISNGGFESGTDPWMLHLGANTATFSITSDAYTGSSSGKLTATSVAAGSEVGLQQYISPVVNETYVLSFWYKATGDFMFYVSVTDADWNVIDRWRSLGYVPEATTWTSVEITVGPIPTASYAHSWVSFDLDSNGEFQIDDVSLTVSETPPPNGSENGEIFLLFGKWISQDLIDKIIATKQSTGYPDYVDVGNWGDDRAHWLSDHFTEDKIVQLQGVGIKTICHIPTDHQWITEQQVYNMIDHQMNIGPSIDGFFFDVTPNFWDGRNGWASAYWERYIRMRDYVRNLGKILFVNPGTKNIHDDTCISADYVCVEFDWTRFGDEKQDLIARYPTKFQGFSTATNPSNCVDDTIRAWNLGVFVFGPSVELTMTDSLWEQYLSQLPT